MLQRDRSGSAPPAPSATHGYDAIADFYDAFVDHEDRWLHRTSGYHGFVERIYRAMVPRGQRVLEIGCGRGDLLAALEPSHGLGVDVSPKMIEAARARHPELEFECSSGEALQRNETFDYIILSDLVPYAQDLQALFTSVAAHCHTRTRVIVNTYSNAWRPLLSLLARLGLRARRPIRNWVAPRDLVNLFELAGLEVVAQRSELLLPAHVPGLTRLANALLVRLPGVRQLALTSWLVGRPAPRRFQDYGVTVVVPCRNEAGMIAEIADRIPQMGRATEVIFVEGGSTDDTRERIQAEIARRPDREMRLLVQSGKGKANAVREAFAAARHEILMILDADLTVAPEDLPRFYDALASGRGEVVNGTRLVYGMEPGAMRFLNMLGNKFFASLMSVVLGQYVKDTLCGTKVLHRDDYQRLEARRHEFGEDDPYGDFDLLLGASLLGLKIVNLPVRYGARRYGETNIHRFSEGTLLLRLAVAGYRRLWLRPVDE
jgi:SAM-dependent methyltransferase